MWDKFLNQVRRNFRGSSAADTPELSLYAPEPSLEVPESLPESEPMAIELANWEKERVRLGPIPEEAFEEVEKLVAANKIAEALERAADLNFDNVFNVLSQRFHDFSPQERLIYAEARPFVLATPQAVISLVRSIDYLVANNIPGAFVECGVYRGGSVITMIRTLLLHGQTDRDIYLFDTFEGMPKPESRDVFYTGESAEVTWKQLERDGVEAGSNWVFAGLEEVRTRILSLGYPESRLHFVKGLVEDTLPESAPDQIALLRLDTDFYSSTKHELVHLFPRLSSSGVLIIDDYGAFKGSKIATDEYIAQQKLSLLLMRVDEHVRFAVKAPAVK